MMIVRDGMSAAKQALYAGNRRPVESMDDIERYLLVDTPAPLDRTAPGAAGTRGTERVRELLAALGNPQDRLRVVHVAGTAGKGSVAAFVTAILTAHGLRVGSQLSPHVHSILERFQLGGRPADVPTVGRVLTEVREANAALARSPRGPATLFEVLAAAAFRMCLDARVDYAVMEAGIGGLSDATNVVDRADKLAILTTIGLDHTDVLGPILSDIAVHKAGILPVGGHALAAAGTAEVETVLAGEAARRGCGLERLGPADVAWLIRSGTRLGLPGAHQRDNAALAVRAAQYLAERDGWILDPVLVAEALASVRLPGRFECRAWCGRDIVLDGAHNPTKLAALAATVAEQFPGRRPLWVLSFKQGKDVTNSLWPAVPGCAVVATTYATTGANRGRGTAVPAGVVAAAAARCGAADTVVVDGVAAALERAVRLAPPQTPVVVAGSFCLVAQVSEALCSERPS